jgi:uncharacterized protein (DUF1684 family)
MRPDPVGDSWRSEIGRERQEKDRLFAETGESPLPESARGSFQGLDYLEPDPDWRWVGHIESYPSAPRFTIVTTNGVPRPCEKVGWLSFAVKGEVGILQVYRLLDQDRTEGDEGLFLPFQDATTGRETYPAGRYVDLEGPPGGPYVLDFNKAYNPLCAYGSPDRYRCPSTPSENRLPFPVEAGERGWHRPRSGHAG